MKEVPAASADDNDNFLRAAEVLTSEDWACAGLRLVRVDQPFADIPERPSLSEICEALERGPRVTAGRPAAAPKARLTSGLPTLPPPRFIKRTQAAAILAVSVGTFDKMVLAGTMPPAISIPGHRRKVWDRMQVERACAALSGEPMLAETRADQPNPWDMVLQ